MPDLIEDEIIEIKDSFIENGFKEGIKTAVDSAINLGKSAMGIVTGRFENVNQMQTAVKTGGIIDGISSVLNYTINKIVDRGKIPYSVGNIIKRGKNAILNTNARYDRTGNMEKECKEFDIKNVAKKLENLYLNY